MSRASRSSGGSTRRRTRASWARPDDLLDDAEQLVRLLDGEARRDADRETICDHAHQPGEGLHAHVGAQLAVRPRLRDARLDALVDFRRARLVALAEVLVGAQAPADLEIDGEPGRVLLEHYPQHGEEALVRPDRAEPLRVARGKREEEVVLRGEV